MIGDSPSTLARFKNTVREEIETLRALGAKRQALSLHACKRLFFDLGQKPSTVLVRELTGVGSASDIPKDIDVFWAQLRESANFTAGKGHIPAELEETAGQLLGQLFAKATELASRRLQAEQGQTDARVELLEQRERETQIREELIRQEIERVRAEQQETLNRERQINEQWLIERQRNQQLSNDIAESKRQIDLLHAQMTSKDQVIEDLNRQVLTTVERCAAEVKIANTEAERRIRPLLIELDALRSASQKTAQTSANRQEFELIQQLSSLKRNLDAAQNMNRDLETELAAYRAQAANPDRADSVTAPQQHLIVKLAAEHRLTAQEITALGSSLDTHVVPPQHCPNCAEPPELFSIDGRFELSCANCGRESGLHASKLAALAAF